MSTPLDSRLERIEGHILGTQIALRAIVLSSPHAEAIVSAIQTELDRWHASLSYSNTKQAFLDGLHSAAGRVLPSAKDWQRRASGPETPPGQDPAE